VLTSRDPVDSSDVTLTSLANGLLEASLSVVGGDAFIKPEPERTAVGQTAPVPFNAEPAAAPPVDLATLTGTPYSADSAVRAWTAGGLTVSQYPLTDPGLTGMAGKAVGLKLSTEGGELAVALLIYPDAKSVGGDWQTASGQKPQIKPERSLPPFETVWWNQNAIVLVLGRSGSPPSAFDAFLKM
jgi:hypothetical protein